MKIILGSQSPRRKEILEYFTLPFLQVPSEFDETSVPFDGNPHTYVTELSRKKANALYPQFPNDVILTADTIVWKDGKIYGKPADDTEGMKFLRALSGQWHSVYTGLFLRKGDRTFHNVTETRVLMQALTDTQIEIYCKQLHFSDKAGGYMIQQGGGIIIERIEGCYYNVVGLPVHSLQKILLFAGIDLWEYLRPAR